MDSAKQPLLLPRASLRQLLSGKATLVGSRLDSALPRGLFSPIEAYIHSGLEVDDLAQQEKLDLQGASTAKVILKSLLTRVLFYAPNGTKPPAFKLCGVNIHNLKTDEFLQRLASWDSAASRSIYFANAHNLNLCTFDARLRETYNNADFVLADGAGIRIAAKWMKVLVKENLNGTNLFPLLCRRWSEHRRTIYLVGGKPGVADQCSEKMTEQYPGCKVVALADGYQKDYGFLTDYFAQHCSMQDRGILMVGMGAPMQEFWIEQHKAVLQNVDIFAVGGLLDFYSGNVQRAPEKWQAAGLEWVWRIKQEPRRLWKRYVLGNPFFLASSVWWRWRS